MFAKSLRNKAFTNRPQQTSPVTRKRRRKHRHFRSHGYFVYFYLGFGFGFGAWAGGCSGIFSASSAGGARNFFAHHVGNQVVEFANRLLAALNFLSQILFLLAEFGNYLILLAFKIQ